MNWLAHVYLSEPDVEFRLGNLLADLVKGRDRAGMSARFLDGVRRHQAIDCFTDAHPVVHRSRARIGGQYRHLTGILVDVFYDHFLAAHWDRYSSEPLQQFTGRLYAEFRAHPLRLPALAQFALERMIADDRLGSYRRIAGIEETLARLSLRIQERTGRQLALENAVGELVENRDGLESDFAEFFPLLERHVQGRSSATI